MTWAILFLVKSAMRLRPRVRAGLVSPMALERLNAVPKPTGRGPERPVLPQPGRVTAGLERGNATLMKRYGIVERPMSEHETGGLRIPMHSRVDEPELTNKYLPKAQATIAQIPLHARQEEQAAREAMDEAKYFGPRRIMTEPLRRAKMFLRRGDYPNGIEEVPPNELAMLLRRHEIDEIREILRQDRRGKLMQTRQTTHTSPAVISREGANISMLSPATQRELLANRINTGDLGTMLNKDPKSLTGPYAWLREPPSSWLSGLPQVDQANWDRNTGTMRAEALAAARRNA